MKIIRTLFLLLIAVYGSSVVAKPMLKATFSSTTLYYGIGPSTFDRSILLNVMVDTHDGVYYGTWQLGGVLKIVRYPYNPGRGQSPRRRLCYAISITALRAPVARICQRVGTIVALLPWILRYKAMTMVAPGWQRVVSLLLMVSLAKRIPRRIRAVQFARKFPLILLISPGMRTFRNRKQPSCLMPPVAR